MKEKIERLSKGDFEYELPFICLSEEEINITVEAGRIYKGYFNISNCNNRRMKGMVISSSRLMLIEKDSTYAQKIEFCDVDRTVQYEINAAYLEDGDLIDGEFNIISDCGEKVLPFHIIVEAAYCMSSLGKIMNLTEFTNLARMDWSEAKRIFRSEDFERIFLSGDQNYQLIYRNLIKSISTSQALEEFLVSIQKKSEIRLDIDRTQIEYQGLQEVISDKLTLSKSNWGYAEIRVSADVPFIQLEQKYLWADRFIGNTNQVTFRIDPKNLSIGNNYGHILIKTAYQTIKVEILCKNHRVGHKMAENSIHQRMNYSLTDNYLCFRLEQLDLSEYIEKTGIIMEELPGPEISHLKDLVRIHLAIISGKMKLAGELLADYARVELSIKRKSVLEYCIYLYLNALYQKEDSIIKNTAEVIRDFYDSGYNEWRILWLLLYTDKRFETNKNIKLSAIREQFEAGCRSPIIYYEAVCIFNDEPYLLKDLSEFEIQAMNFGIKNDIISRETARQYTYLAGKKKKFDQLIFRGLVKLYDKYDTPDILSAIICLLIKGLKKSEQYFEWYHMGVEAQLRITDLYEYYMYTVNDQMQDMLPQPVLLYFIYNSNLNDRKKAFLYANIVRYKEEITQIYRAYNKRMELFTQKMLEGHYISHDLAVLYREFLGKTALTEDQGKHLPYVMYRHEFTCYNINMVSAIVIHKETGMEENIPLTEGKAQVDLYTKNYEIILTDSFGNRYAKTVEYTLTPYMDLDCYELQCILYSDHPMLLLHMYDYYTTNNKVNDTLVEITKKVLQIEGLSKEYVTDCHLVMIEYYYENCNDEQLEYHLNQINLLMLKPSTRMKIIEYMVIRGFYEKALGAFEYFSYEGMSINPLVKLCSGWVQSPSDEKEQQFILKLCYYVFSKEKYDEVILLYLVRHYRGATLDMYRLWKAAKGFDLDCSMLEERLLSQMLFTESLLNESFPVFNVYYSNITNHVLVRAYLTFCAYQNLVHEKSYNDELFLIMKHELFYEENDICLLAWLKNNAKRSSLSENELIFIEYNIKRFVAKGIILPFFLQYEEKVLLPDRIADKSFITYHADPKNQVFIHYSLNHSKEITERMKDVFMGIHVKELLLFYGEEIQYFITEETKEGVTATKELSFSYQDYSKEDGEANLHQINRMLKMIELQQDNQLQVEMENYVKKEYMIAECFKQID